MIWLIFSLGLLLGFFIGVVTRDALDTIGSDLREARVLSTPAHRKMTMLLVVGMLAQVAVGVLLVVTRKSAEDYAECTAEWQQEFATGYQARYAIAQDVDAALDDIVQAMALGDREKAKKAVAAYIRLRARQDRQRSANPLPPLPETSCGAPSEVRR